MFIIKIRSMKLSWSLQYNKYNVLSTYQQGLSKLNFKRKIIVLNPWCVHKSCDHIVCMQACCHGNETQHL